MFGRLLGMKPIKDTVCFAPEAKGDGDKEPYFGAFR